MEEVEEAAVVIVGECGVGVGVVEEEFGVGVGVVEEECGVVDLMWAIVMAWVIVGVLVVVDCAFVCAMGANDCRLPMVLIGAVVSENDHAFSGKEEEEDEEEEEEDEWEEDNKVAV